MATTALKGTPAFGIVQISFFSADGKDLGTVETKGSTSARAKLSNEVSSTSPVGEWIYLDTGVATAPAGTASVQAFTLFVDYSGAKYFQGHIDEVRMWNTARSQSQIEAGMTETSSMILWYLAAAYAELLLSRNSCLVSYFLASSRSFSYVQDVLGGVI